MHSPGLAYWTLDTEYMYMYACTYICIYIERERCIYICIYIYRERERERAREMFIHLLNIMILLRSCAPRPRVLDPRHRGRRRGLPRHDRPGAKPVANILYYNII